ncbi:RsmB/NOP family class I SAM-dependent RNA methyltransferase [Pedobacter sp. MC2016-15]|uniref:RsmB/NOP family class I SAM-dependent RNA methyltransferase n=1 Tax=Pedobacter sp. MC2016-15 TaxID=2994473 RepID=UPI002248243E|nr:RsmB/NOP family class I SAM-dependent RNA methyltransferase [Pedobacter sp. MC2016-15]MCX2479187.1 RsmB/NOP family class I SAM-dependent RNA methyltransferase [Pedobacter sp. MC2016-15]
MKLEYQVRAFEQAFDQYDGVLPLHRFLFTYFKQHKQMGSSDRRWTTRYLYSYFRLGQALKKEERLLRLAIADFLCNQTESLVISNYLPLLKDQLLLPVQAKIALIQDAFPDFNLEDVFPFKAVLSEGIAEADFLQSFFIQPDLFLRVKEDQQVSFLELLAKEEVAVKIINAKTLALPNGTKLEKLLPDNMYYQVQDLSSQMTGEYFNPKPYEYWWDCCAASGGKSLLLHDLEPKVQLLVSDVRENSLHNLDERFQAAGIRKYQKKVLDLLQNNDQDLHDYVFDGIILDAPCSGSGTWGRTPEMLYHFEEHKIEFFAGLQKNIGARVVKYLKPGKALIYITCSVFQKENEAVIEHLLATQPLKLESMQSIRGYNDQADTMFIARLIKD